MFSGQDHLSKLKKIQFNNSSLVKKGKLPFFIYNDAHLKPLKITKLPF